MKTGRIRLKWYIFIIMVPVFLLLARYFTANQEIMNRSAIAPDTIKLFLCGDVMTGRGIDQIQERSVHPVLYESYVKDARQYVMLAEQENGPVEQPVSSAYVWGDAMSVWAGEDPLFRLINLETGITVNPDPWPGKGINYRMHPANVDILTAASIDFCSLANNHTLDWSRKGLIEMLRVLKKANIAVAGAGRDITEANQPAILENGGSRVLILAYGSETSGIPSSWAADEKMAGINLLPGLGSETVRRVADQVAAIRMNGDIVVFSIHWGGNWGYEIPPVQQEFVHRLIDEAGIDIIHGHSSHHPLGIEVYNRKLILYGAGDFINDYEGISGHEQYQDDLTLMYFPEIDPTTGNLRAMKLYPMQIRKMKLNRAGNDEAIWLMDMLNREGKELGTSVEMNDDGSLSLLW